jgi:succinyl-diaminopimelate desuccinylase
LSPTLDLAQQLISRPSVTPADAGCCALVAQRLEPLGFKAEIMPFGDVTNLWAVREGGRPGPTLVLAGHVDVVPPGPLEAWRSDPFTPTIHDHELVGRGAADMKSSVAAFITATERFIQQHPSFAGRLAYH